jgi:hypothetical protein
LLSHRIAHNKIPLIFLGIGIPAFAEEKAAAALLDLEALVAPQERESRVDHRGPSPRQIAEFEVAISICVVMEEAGQGLRRPLTDVWAGAESEPRPRHTLEAAQRPVGHPRQDLHERALREAPRGLLLLLLLPHLLLPPPQMALVKIAGYSL